MARSVASGRVAASGRIAVSSRAAVGRYSSSVTPATLASGILHTDLVEDLGIDAPSAIWSDQSGNGNTATGQAAALPTYSASGGPNNLPYWTCASTYFNFADVFSPLTQAEVFLVFRRMNPASGHDGLWRFGPTGARVPFPGDGTVYDDFGTTVRKQTRVITAAEDPNNSWILYNVTTAANLYTIRINGKQIFNTTSNTVLFPAACALGLSAGAVNATLRVSRLTVFNRALTSAERLAIVNNYYLPRYAIASL